MAETMCDITWAVPLPDPMSHSARSRLASMTSPEQINSEVQVRGI